jgi:hypothetical protein
MSSHPSNFLGSDALTSLIMQQVWRANDTIQKTLGGPCRDLALIRQCLVSLSKIAINRYDLWATTNFDNAHIINDDALCCHPPSDLRHIIRSLQDPTTAEYVQEPLTPGTICINILLMTLQNSTLDPSSITGRCSVLEP